MNSRLAALGLFVCCLTMPAQVRKVDPQKTITFVVAGATAAYSLDSSLAEATAEDGVVSITGKQPGTTHVVAITNSGVQTFEVVITKPPPHYPPGFLMPTPVSERAQSGYYEGRYYSSPAQIQNQLDFLKIHGDNRTHMHLVETNLLGPLAPGQARIALSSASYRIVTPRRDITLLDDYVDESPLTLNGSMIRGFHIRQGKWFGHAGYTTVAAFQGLFLPTQPELVAGGGYAYTLTPNSSLTGSFYYIRIPATDLIGRSGNLSAVTYKYSPRENFWLTAEAGISNGLGGAGRLFYRTERDSIVALTRFVPSRFAALGANNFRGLHTDASWTRHQTKRFDTTLTFYNNNVVLPSFRQTTLSGAAHLRFQLSRQWSLTGGVLASRFQTKGRSNLSIRSFTLPAGIAFQSRHFGASAQYQFAVTPGRESGGKQARATARAGWGPFTFSGYAQHDTNAPTLSFVFSQVTGLEQILNLQGIQATTIQQVDELLSSNSFLIGSGYIKGATINLVPVRSQIGGTADWSSRGAHRRQLGYSFILNDNQMLQGSTQDIGHTISYSQNVSRSDDLAMGCTVLGVTNPGRPPEYSPLCFISWRHQFKRVPYFIMPERQGTIAGNVFRDDRSRGGLEAGMRPMPEVEVTLDGRRRTITGADGSYRFHNVARGPHRIVAIYRSSDPFFFTTPSALEVDENETVNFGIGFSLSGLMGTVLNDAGAGVGGVTVAMRSRGLKWTATTDAGGSFFVSGLVAGEYVVEADEDSLPAGYAAAEAFDEPRRVTVGASSPGKAAFTARAFRSISGRVLIYDSKTGDYVPVNAAQVSLRQPALTAKTDLEGRYLFRDLPAGSYLVSVQNEPPPPARTVRLGDNPMDVINVDFQISRFVLQIATELPVVIPVMAVNPPQPEAKVIVVAMAPRSGTAQEHHRLGRELTQARRYPEAIRRTYRSHSDLAGFRAGLQSSAILPIVTRARVGVYTIKERFVF
jgi:hypothetical protein